MTDDTFWTVDPDNYKYQFTDMGCQSSINNTIVFNGHEIEIPKKLMGKWISIREILDILNDYHAIMINDEIVYENKPKPEISKKRSKNFMTKEEIKNQKACWRTKYDLFKNSNQKVL
jgi:hypothetical protein